MKILGFGIQGMIGTRVMQVLQDKYQFENASRATGTDITNSTQVFEKITSSDAQVIFNFAAKANVDACEIDKELGKNGEAWQVNVDGVKNIIEACKRTNKKLLQISTDFVFDGENTPDGGFSEDHEVNPINWYAITKAKADELIKESQIPYLILRPAFPYTFIEAKKHFVAAIYNRLLNNLPLTTITDEIFTPTWIDDIAHGAEFLLDKNVTGLFHIGGTHITPFEASTIIADNFSFDKSLIIQTTREKYFEGKARRPFNTSLKSDKIFQLGLKATTFQEGLEKIKENIL